MPTVSCSKNVCIIIPAYNEESRIQNTLETYIKYFSTKPEKTIFLVVANNCSDKTVLISKGVQKKHSNIVILNFAKGGKGFAVKKGFLWALKRNFDLIGFVDADMATKPQHFYDLVIASNNHDGAIASRYVKGAVITPSRPIMIKIFGKIYNWILRKKLGLPYRDTQCGAKIFSHDTIEKITSDMVETGWSFDLEILYLCKLIGKDIAEIPTTWSDQPGSHLEISSTLIKEFTSAQGRIKKRHEPKRKKIAEEKKALQKNQKLVKNNKKCFK